MHAFYETQERFDRNIEPLSYRVDFSWSTENDGKGAQVGASSTGEDSSFYEEDDQFNQLYTSVASGFLLKGVPNECASSDQTQATAYLQASNHSCPSLTNRLCSQPTVALNASDVELAETRQPQEKRRLDIERRNSRERVRVRAVNEAFVRLRRLVPSTRCSLKRVSKRSTLTRAVEYIRELQQRLTNASSTSPTAFPGEHTAPSTTGAKNGPGIGFHATALRPHCPPTPIVSVKMKIDKL